VYAQTDRIMLEAMVGLRAVGLYSVAVTLAGAISIVPAALIEGYRPEILLRAETDTPGYVRRMRQLYGLVFWLCMAYCLLITVLARPLVLLLYGPDYAGAVPALSIVVWYTAFSYFGSINNLYLVSRGKTQWVAVLTLTGAILNVALNALLIPVLEIRGAALASLASQFAANFLLLLCIPALWEAFFLQVQGIALLGFVPPNKHGPS
jgi:O-antigen/teichoic acid export membrane protein